MNERKTCGFPVWMRPIVIAYLTLTGEMERVQKRNRVKNLKKSS